MRSLVRSLFLVAAIGMTGTAALAQGPGSYARETGFPGSVQIDTSFVASDGCQAILDVGRGAPAGVALPRDVVPVVVVVGPDPRGCTGQQVLRRVFNIGGGSLLNLIQIFFIAPDGRVLDTEKISVSPY